MAIISSTIITTNYGNVTVNYHQAKINFDFESCLSITSGNLTSRNCAVRIHSSCVFSESLGSIDCDCSLQLQKSLEFIAKKGGVIIYLFQEGRGLGLINKIKSMETEQTEGIDTVEAFTRLHFALDPRSYTIAIKALRELGINKKIRLISNNPRKKMQLEEGGFTITKRIKFTYLQNKLVKAYLKVKKEKLGHEL